MRGTLVVDFRKVNIFFVLTNWIIRDICTTSGVQDTNGLATATLHRIPRRGADEYRTGERLSKSGGSDLFLPHSSGADSFEISPRVPIDR